MNTKSLKNYKKWKNYLQKGSVSKNATIESLFVNPMHWDQPNKELKKKKKITSNWFPVCFSSLNVWLLHSLHVVHIKLRGTIFHMPDECLPPIFFSQAINQSPSLLNPIHPKRSENKTPQVIAHLATNFSLQISPILKRFFFLLPRKNFDLFSSLIPFLSLPLSLGKHNFNQRGKKQPNNNKKKL